MTEYHKYNEELQVDNLSSINVIDNELFNILKTIRKKVSIKQILQLIKS